jgi:serine phosphatase RsbU (regulator of sigma subunit)
MRIKYYFYIPCLFFFLLVIQTLPGWAQVKNKGIPFIKNYTTDNYHAHDQNWFISQDQRGVIYVANSLGVLEFDGVKWRLLDVPNKPVVRIVRLGLDGVMYVGAENFIGYIDVDSTGNTYVASLMDQVPKEITEIKNIWESTLTKQGLMFSSRYALFILNNKKVTTIRPERSFAYLRPIQDTAYVIEAKKDRTFETRKIVNNQLVDAKDILKKQVIYHSLNLSPQQTLLVIGQHLKIYDGKSIQPFAPHLEAFFLKNKIYSLVKINKNHFAIGTLDYGVVILNNQGKVIQHIHKGNGLQDNSVYGLYVDQQHNLWAGLSRGIAFIELNSPFSVLDASSGLDASTYCTQVYKNFLGVGTSQGFFYKNWKAYENPLTDSIHFKTVPNLLSQIWQFKIAKNQLLAGYNPGILLLEDMAIDQVELKKLNLVNYNTWTIVSLPHTSERLLTGGLRGLAILEWKNKKWQFKYRIKGFSKNSRYIGIDQSNQVWMTDDNQGAYKITLNAQLDSVTKFKLYDKTKGFPSNSFNRLFNINGKNLFATENGIYVYDKAQDQMVRETALNQLIGDHKMIIYLRNDAQQGIWYVAQKTQNGVKDKYLEVGLLTRQKNGTYKKTTTPFRKLRGSFIEKLAPHLNPVDSNNILFATREGLIHFSPNKPQKKQAFTILLRKVSLLTETKDSIIFNGSFTNAQKQAATNPTPDYVYPVFEYQHNSFRFNVSSTFYADNDKNEFRYRLKGLDKKWSPWTKETYKEYLNLREGKYILYIQTRNLYLEESKVLSYQFTVFAPWHRTIWAYMSYVLIGILLVILIIRLYTKRLKQQKTILEQKVQQRTIQLEQKQEEIMMQHAELQQKHEEITTQRDFIAQKNIQVQKSIEAAKLIQDAILPFDDRVQSIFAQYFVLFRPRDIVSGDFYWVEKAKNDLNIRLIAAIDCTGHGVPGAFMSMISYTLLNDIVLQQNITDPAQILEVLRQELKHSLQKEKTKNQSGMDIALCKITQQQDDTIQVIFAGAKRPMYYFKADTQEFLEAKGDRISIGITTRKKSFFKAQSITLHKNDLIFLTTDGYSDQNNVARKSFGSSKLKELLAANALLPLNKQKQILEQQLDDYMVNTTQRDDILVIGVKL